ncbi:MAG: hypothetical protein ABIQ61_12570 [Ornithinibacter sp.]
MKKAGSTTHANGLVLRWVPVTSADGRTRMEMRWSAPPAVLRQLHIA